ncbi:MAG: xanthine dehydrogenase family protein molybdopterin-binding subunit [Gammaproteobacteria bacterium]|nr:xanthine dehydrogenase family protein molybdopterin-binding subunit [Gammaproteobacteria bacterium]
MTRRFDPSRRRFIIASAAAGTGLALGVSVGCSPDEPATARRAPRGFEPNIWLRVGTDDTITVIVSESEMGQGVTTGLPMLIAEELEVELDAVRIEQAPVDPRYGSQSTGGSTSIRHAWRPLREAGAVAREMLVAAAAATWGVPASECRAVSGAVVHETGGRRLPYGELADTAATLSVPEEVALKAPEEFRLIGRSPARLDGPDKVTGRAEFGIDVELPGMLTATIAHPPRPGAKLGRLEDAGARALPGVREVVTLDRGVAVIAEDYWTAAEGLRALELEWTGGSEIGSERIWRDFREAAQRPGANARSAGDAERALREAARTVEATYELPFQAHAPMEPMNCTAWFHDGRCEIWAPTQARGEARDRAAGLFYSAPGRLLERARGKLTGRKYEDVQVHTTLLGGGFGRRLEQDYVAEAVQIAMAVDAPVKLIWSREEDIAHDFYRPASYHVLRGGLDARGIPVAWTHKIVGPSIKEWREPGRIGDGVDPTSVSGAADLAYALPDLSVDYVMAQTDVPIGPWRSVGHSFNAFVVESFIDELAAAGGHDPLELRLRLLRDAPRHRAALELAAERAGWGGSPSPAEGRARGLAVHYSYGGYVAQVAEVSVDDDGAVRVHRVVCAADCGTVIHPDLVAAQMEGAIVFGLTAALKGEITLDGGRVVQSNFHDFPLLEFGEMPAVEVHLVPSAEPPGGVGEPGVPPIAPALANAVFAATGHRPRRLPIQSEDLRG